jgi:starch phosphorylase
VTLEHSGDDGGAARFTGSFPCSTAGRHGFTVRVLPAHADLVSPVELGRTVWA